MRKSIVFIISVVLLTGCAKLKHLDQLLTLKGLADEQAALAEYVDERDQQFESMLKEAKAGTLDQYRTKKEFRRIFGEPVYARTKQEGDQALEIWLYRYAAEFFGSEKIYLYFDPDGNLLKSEYMEPQDG